MIELKAEHSTEQKKERKRYFDTLKIIAIFIVFTTHFVATFNEDYFALWTELPTAILLKGVSGKFGVAIFSVILGYFAFRSSERNLAKYTVKRYVYFVLCGLFINTIYAVFAQMGYFIDPVPAVKVIRTSLLLGSSIYPTFWCIRPFMIGSVLSRINGMIYGKAGTWVTLMITAAEIALLIRADQIWVAICIMGNITIIAEKDPRISRLADYQAVRAVIYIVFFFAIKRSGSDLTYLIDGASVTALLFALSGSKRLAGILSNRHLASQGMNTMAIYMIHNFMYEIIGKVIISGRYFTLTFIIAWIVSWAAIVAVSYPVTRILNTANKWCGRGIDRILAPTDRLFYRKATDKQDI